MSLTEKKPNPLVVVFAWVLGVLGLFALNLFAIEPLVHRVASPAAAQLLYVILRIVGFIGLAYGLTRYAGRNRFQVMSSVLLVGVVDQVLFKGFWLKRDMEIHPAAWQGFEPTNAAIFVTLAKSYLFFIPILLILSFLGMESTRFRRDWQLNK
jgi:hypothetical protein